MPNKVTTLHMTLFAALMASAPAADSLAAAPQNPYLQVGIDALASGLRTVTVGLEVGNGTTLVKRMNEVHWGMQLSGWALLTQEVVNREGTSRTLLMTYGRQLSPNPVRSPGRTRP